MKPFLYRIVGRSGGQIEFTGLLTASTPKAAILASLVMEFGDRNIAKPHVNRLCDGGWIDQKSLMEHLVGLDDLTQQLHLDSGGHSLDIAVMSSIGGA